MRDPFTSLPEPLTIGSNYSKYPIPGQLALNLAAATPKPVSYPTDHDLDVRADALLAHHSLPSRVYAIMRDEFPEVASDRIAMRVTVAHLYHATTR